MSIRSGGRLQNRPGFERARPGSLVGFVLVLASLVVLLSFQYSWLRRVERAAAAAEAATVHAALFGVTAEVEHFCRGLGDRLLTLPPQVVLENRTEEAAAFWRERYTDGVERLFLVDYSRDNFGNFQVYDPVSASLRPAIASDEMMAVIIACSPWQLVGIRGSRLGPAGIRVDERDPRHRILLNPILDDSTLVGLSGLILDADYIQRTFLPEAVKRVVPADGGLALLVRDEAGRTVFGTLPNETGPSVPSLASMRMPFAFTDWTLGVHRKGPSPAEWTRSSLRIHLLFSVLLAGLLLAGTVLTFRAANRAVRLSRMKTDFVSNVSHELRTPVASIQVFGEFLRTGRVDTPERVQEYGARIEEESRRLARLMDKILEFSSLEAGRRAYQFVPTDFSALVRRCVERFRSRPEAAGYSFSLHVPDAIPPLEMDGDAMERVLDNLLENAVKYSGESRAVSVELSDGPEVTVSVRDEGIGIAHAEQERIFDRFHRVAQGAVHDVKGTGLGLAIVDHIVRAHGGRVEVDSGLGKGSTFSVRLPRSTRR